MDINLFKYCSGLKVLGYLMIALVFAIVGLTYDAVVIIAWGPQLLQGGIRSFLAFVVLILFHILLILLTWSYFMVVFKDPGSVPENWRPILEENIEEGASISNSDYVAPETSTSTSALASSDGMDRRPAVGYCNRCQNGKPPRCHHCSVCQRCVLKMDHHCVWVVNCVGAQNYKFFLLFLFYTFLETILDAIVLLPRVIILFGEAVDHSGSAGSITVTFLAFILNVAFAFSLLCFLAMHASLVSSNTTTIEVYEKKKSIRWKYDLGRKKNFQQVFGTKKALWFFPLFSKDDFAASSTETLVVAKAAPATNAMYMSNASDRRLFVRLSKLGATGGKASDVLNKYMREGRQIKKQNLMDCFRTFRKFKRYQICLELLEWLEQHKFHLSERDYAVYLDIIFKTKGVEEAEKYFNSLSSVSKNLYSYGALLNCYCMERMTEKAFSLFKEMEQLNYASTCLAFNNMMRLCLNEGKPERVPPLLQEMRKSEVSPDRYTYNIVLQSYAAMNDVKGIESILEEMQPEQCDWTSFSNLVTVYNKVGLPDKAELVLHQLEKFLENQKHPERMAYHYLITLYAGTGNLDAVNRAWEALNSKYPPCSNLSYLCMLQSLSKLDDIKGLKTCYEEWESRCRIYDNRLTAVVINAYLRHDMLEKAEKAYVIANIRSRFPCVKAHECFIAYFLGKGETDRALVHLEHLVEAQSVMEGTRWRPSTRIIHRALEYFEREKDVKNAEKLCRVLKKSKHLDSKGYLLLLQVYVAAGETEPEMRQRMEKDGIDISSEHESLLDNVCVQ